MSKASASRSTTSIGRKKQLFIASSITVLLAGTFGILALVGNTIRHNDAARTFMECIARDGSVIQESYPEVCVTKSGERFVNPDQHVSAP